MTQTTLNAIKDTLRAQYIAHEISADTYATLSEDIAVIERRNRRS